MTDILRDARSKMQSKAERFIAGDKPGKVDCSDYTPEPLDVESNEKNSGQPNNPRMRYKRGGTVVAAEGDKPKVNAGKRPRAARSTGGDVAGYHVVDSTGSVLKRTKQRGTAEKALERISNRDSGSDTPGIRNMKHYVRPVPAEKYDMNTHEDLADQYHKGYFDRSARASGGRTKGKTNINIVIAPGGGQPQPGGPPPMMPPIGAAPVAPPPEGALPPQGAPAPAASPPMGMPRKDGGRTIKKEFGAGGGKGRLEKKDKY